MRDNPNLEKSLSHTLEHSKIGEEERVDTATNETKDIEEERVDMAANEIKDMTLRTLLNIWIPTKLYDFLHQNGKRKPEGASSYFPPCLWIQKRKP